MRFLTTYLGNDWCVSAGDIFYLCIFVYSYRIFVYLYIHIFIYLYLVWLHIWVMIGVCRLVTTGSPLPFQFPATFVDCLIPDFRSNIIHLSTAWFRKHIIPALHLSTLEAYQWYYHSQTRILAKMDRWCIKLDDVSKILYNSNLLVRWQYPV